MFCIINKVNGPYKLNKEVFIGIYNKKKKKIKIKNKKIKNKKKAKKRKRDRQ
jgi:hypothetical protein